MPDQCRMWDQTSGAAQLLLGVSSAKRGIPLLKMDPTLWWVRVVCSMSASPLTHVCKNDPERVGTSSQVTGGDFQPHTRCTHGLPPK
jgi:hypothetical protein